MARNCVCRYSMSGDWKQPRECRNGTANGARYCRAHEAAGPAQEIDLAQDEASEINRRKAWPFWPGNECEFCPDPGVMLVKGPEDRSLWVCTGHIDDYRQPQAEAAPMP